MNVLYLHQYFVTPEQGGGIRSYEMGRRLVEMGHEVDIVTTDQSGEASAKWTTEEIAGMRVHATPVAYKQSMSFARRLWSFLVFAWRAALKARSIDCDVVLATSTPLTIALPGAHAASRHGVPMVLELRDNWPLVPIAVGALGNPVLRGVALWLERYAYRNASHIVALSPGIRDHVVGMGFDPNRVTVIPNSADIGIFDRDPADVAAFRREHDWLGDRPLAVYLGALGLVNGVDFVVEMAARALDIDPELRFVVAGRGAMEEQIRELAAEKGVLDVNFFMVGFVPKDEVALWLASAGAAFVLFTGPEAVWRDTSPNKLFDALAAGKAVMADFDAHFPQVARDHGAGEILDPDDLDGSAALLCERLRDGAWLESAGAAARALAEDRYERGMLAMRLEGVLSETVTAAHVGRHGQAEA